MRSDGCDPRDACQSLSEYIADDGASLQYAEAAKRAFTLAKKKGNGGKREEGKRRRPVNENNPSMQGSRERKFSALFCRNIKTQTKF